MEANTRVASLNYHRMNRAICLAAKNSFKDWKSKFPPSVAIKLERIQNEVLLIIDALVWFNRLKGGYNLDQLSKWQPILHFILSILAPYIRSRLLPVSNRNVIWINKMDAIFRLADLLQLLYFYHKGGYQNLTERITHLKVVPRETLGVLNFETLNRKLVWCVFRDLMVLLISFKNSFWGTTKYKRNEKRADLLTTMCTGCQQRVVIPVKSVTCGHISCYICYYTEPFCALCGSVMRLDRFRFLQLSEQNL